MRAQAIGEAARQEAIALIQVKDDSGLGHSVSRGGKKWVDSGNILKGFLMYLMSSKKKNQERSQKFWSQLLEIWSHH